MPSMYIDEWFVTIYYLDWVPLASPVQLQMCAMHTRHWHSQWHPRSEI